jgi:hypothetical protein
MSFEEILDAVAGRVVKAITVLEKRSSSGDSYLSRHTSRFILSATLALLQGPVTDQAADGT